VKKVVEHQSAYGGIHFAYATLHHGHLVGADAAGIYHASVGLHLPHIADNGEQTVKFGLHGHDNSYFHITKLRSSETFSAVVT